jgi:acetyl-CoA C-acetyltransferase
MKQVYIVSTARTPLGSFGGSLASVSATQLGATAVKAAVSKAGIEGQAVQEIFMGNVISANLGQAPARQAAIFAGLGDHVPATTVNKVCASGLKATILAAQTIMLDFNQVVVSGGMESMSNAPYYLGKARYGYGYGNSELVDALVKDGLSDVYNACAMGVCGDQTAEKFGISRQDQDNFAIESYKRAAQAVADGNFNAELAAVEIKDRKGNITLVEQDEEYKKVMFDKIPTLKPVFSPNGTVTAANASTINDGAAALVLMDENALKASNAKPLARIVSFADAAHEPMMFTTAPAKAAELALSRAGLKIEDIDFFEVNEAFAVVTLVFMQHFGLAHEKVNIWGGAVSLGHPIGCSGARILVTLSNVLANKNARYGMAAICNGGGGASAMIIERI